MDENEIYEILAQHGLIDTRKNEQMDIKTLYRGIQCNKSIFLFPKKSKIRQACARISKHRYFERTILVLIVLSSFKLAFDTYLMDYPESSLIVREFCNLKRFLGTLVE